MIKRRHTIGENKLKHSLSNLRNDLEFDTSDMKSVILEETEQNEESEKTSFLLEKR